MKHLITLALFAVPLLATVVEGPLNTPNTTTPFSGTITITPSQQWTSVGGVAVGLVPITVTVTSGSFSVSLEPTDTAIPTGVYYTFAFYPSGAKSYTVKYQVPTSASPVTIAGLTSLTTPPVIISVAGGDLSGSYPNPVVDGLRGIPISATLPTNGQVYAFNSSLNSWIPSTGGGGGGGTTYVSGGSGGIIIDPLATPTPTIDIDTTVVPRKSSSETISGRWLFGQGVIFTGLTFSVLPAPAAGNFNVGVDSVSGKFSCTNYLGADCMPTLSGIGLGDPGSNGPMKRIALNTTAPMVSGVDFYAPGSTVASTDLPNPGASAGGKVRSKTCISGQFVNIIGTDSTVQCGAPGAVGLGAIPIPGPRIPGYWLADGITTAFQSSVGLGLTLIGNTPSALVSTATTINALRINTTTAAGNQGSFYSTRQFRHNKNIYGRIIAAQTQTGVGRTWIGFMTAVAPTDVPGASGVNSAAFRFSTTGPDTNWQCVTSNGSTFTSTIADSGVVVDTDQHQFEITGSSTNFVFAIDGVNVCTITTTLPVGQMQLLGGINNITAAAIRSLDLSLYYAEEDR